MCAYLKSIAMTYGVSVNPLHTLSRLRETALLATN